MFMYLLACIICSAVNTAITPIDNHSRCLLIILKTSNYFQVVISQPKTTWEERVEEERKENTINNAYLLKDIDIDKLLSDDLIISSKMTRAEIMATMEELKGGFELISLDGEDSDYDDDEDEQVCDIGEDKNITTLRQELEDAVNANSIKEGTDTDEPEVEMTEERFDNEVVIHETDEVC